MTCPKCRADFTPRVAATGRVFKTCDECRAKQAEKMSRWRSTKTDSNATYQRAYNLRRRQEALEAYGGECGCCRERHWQFLTFDHAEGGGGKHRIEIATRGNGFVSWLHANGFPAGIRVLCHNCNSSLGYYGECPHSA